MITSTHLFDAPGPKAKRHILIGSILGGLLILAAVVYALGELSSRGQLNADKWSPFLTNPELQAFLFTGFVNTIKVAVVSLVLAMIMGIGLGVGRLSPSPLVRVPCTVFLEVVRGAPVLLSMLFLFLAFPLAFRIELPAFWTVVVALTLYNGAVIAEIVRAGVLTLPRGQREAALAIGLRWGQTMRLILLPQALRVMLPSLVSQLIVLIKDSALGFIVGYQELTAQAQSAALLLNSPLQTFVVIGLIYVLINSVLSAVSGFISSRQQRLAERQQAAAAGKLAAVEPAGVASAGTGG